MLSTRTSSTIVLLLSLVSGTVATTTGFGNGQESLSVEPDSHLNIDSEVNAIEKDATADIVIPKGLDIKEAVSNLNSTLVNSTGLTNQTVANATTYNATAASNGTHDATHSSEAANAGIIIGLTWLVIGPVAALLL